MTNKPTLYISCGLPGAGKSTFLKKTALPSEIIVSRDEIRYSLLKEGEPYFQHEIEVAKLFYAKIAENLSKGKNVYADATHLNNYSRSKLLGQLEPYNLDFNIEVIFLMFLFMFVLNVMKNEPEELKFLLSGF